MLRAVVDANIWVAALANPSGVAARILDAMQQGRFTLVASRPVLAELATILRRPRVASRCRLTSSDVPAVMAYLRSMAFVVEVTGDYHFCRDPEDDKIVETAIRGRAPIIVSHDSDLLDPALEGPLAAHGIRVLTAEKFLAELHEQE